MSWTVQRQRSPASLPGPSARALAKSNDGCHQRAHDESRWSGQQDSEQRPQAPLRRHDERAQEAEYEAHPTNHPPTPPTGPDTPLASQLWADFGVARAVEAAGAGQLTETGLAVGTPDEQQQGEWPPASILVPGGRELLKPRAASQGIPKRIHPEPRR
jgi:hypothetical protein